MSSKAGVQQNTSLERGGRCRKNELERVDAKIPASKGVVRKNRVRKGDCRKTGLEEGGAKKAVGPRISS